MTEKLNDPTTLKNSARRKLVRGAFAVPAVMTLHNGSAFAASSAAACLVNQNLSAQGAPTWVAADDSWFRYQLWVIRKTMTPTQILSYWINGAELSPYVRANQLPFLPTGSWQGFDIATNAFVNSAIATTPSYNNSCQLVKAGPWVVLRVNGQGAIVGAGASGQGSAVSDSCWNSFAIQTT